jgi:hypothetical protein
VSRRIAVAALLALLVFAVALPAAGAPPKRAVFEPGKALAGIRLGMSKQDVLDVWGKRHGVCRSCPRETWYFNYKPFTPTGAGVVFERGRVIHVFTVWQPPGWRTPRGLGLGDAASEATRVYGALDRRQCTFYSALVERGPRAHSVFYVFDDEIWGFGLTEPDASPCL